MYMSNILHLSRFSPELIKAIMTFTNYAVVKKLCGIHVQPYSQLFFLSVIRLSTEEKTRIYNA
jgi:hypothetical protein